MTQTAAPPQAGLVTTAPPATRRPPGFLSEGWFTGP